MNEEKVSYVSANSYPVKIFLNKKFMKKILGKKKILPIHLQLSPTNKCNFNCSFCSCSNRDRAEEIDYAYLIKVLGKFRKLGCEAVTITGGGEPLMHPKINEIIKSIKNKGMEVGLTTNGSLLHLLKGSSMRSLTWCRISSGDSMDSNLQTVNKSLDDWFNSLEKVVIKAPNVDWSFSYVITKEPKMDLIKRFISFSNAHDFKHIRLTPDLLDLKNVPTLKGIEEKIKNEKVDDSRVIYQERTNFKCGRTCFISLLKPFLSADGWVYPCCGTQYALAKPSLDNDTSMRICKGDKIDKVYKTSVPFDGSACQRCYYDSYNELLAVLISDIKHKKFV